MHHFWPWCCSQFRPRRLTPFPVTTVSGKAFDCCPYCTCASSSPTIVIGSPVYVVSFTRGLRRVASGNKASCWLCEMVETATPVSLSIRSIFPSTITSVWKGREDRSQMANSCNSSLFLDPDSRSPAATHLVLCVLGRRFGCRSR